MDIRAALETKLGELSDGEYEFAKEQFEINCEVAGVTRSPAEMLNLMATDIDFYRRNNLGGLQ